GSTKPAAGVIATSPPIAPDMMPSTLGLPRSTHSMNIQARAAAAVAICATSIAIPAVPLAASAEPALKPNQPTHSSDAPISDSVRLCGARLSVPSPDRWPTMIAATSPATPALMCTTVPPAKSSTPALPRNPPPHTQCVTGAYTTSDHSPMNQSMAENFIRSANAPTISAGVMTANVIWNTTNKASGMVPVSSAVPMPLRNILLVPPIQAVPSVKARL